MLSTKDLKQLQQKGISELQFQTQIENFEKGFKLCLKRLVNHLEKGNGEIFDLTLKTNAFYNGEK